MINLKEDIWKNEIYDKVKLKYKQIVEFPVPVKEGYDFIGWYDDIEVEKNTLEKW